MKKIFALLLCLPLLSFAQTSAENSYLKSSWVTGNNLNQTFSLTNKQACAVDIQAKQGGYDTIYHFAAGQTATVVFNAPFISGTGVVFKGLSVCSGNGNTGNITVVGQLSALPVKFNSFTTRIVDDNILEVRFNVAEISGVNRVNIRTSSDGRNFIVKQIVLGAEIVPNQDYVKRIPL